MSRKRAGRPQGLLTARGVRLGGHCLAPACWRPVAPAPPPAQWSWASSSYFSQNLSVKGMQVRNSHHSQRTGEK